METIKLLLPLVLILGTIVLMVIFPPLYFLIGLVFYFYESVYKEIRDRKKANTMGFDAILFIPILLIPSVLLWPLFYGKEITKLIDRF